MSKSYTFQPALSPLCQFSLFFFFTKGVTKFHTNICFGPEMRMTLETTAVPLSRNDKASLLAFLSASRHEHGCLYLAELSSTNPDSKRAPVALPCSSCQDSLTHLAFSLILVKTRTVSSSDQGLKHLTQGKVLVFLLI